jgi:TonB family protein
VNAMRALFCAVLFAAASFNSIAVPETPRGPSSKAAILQDLKLAVPGPTIVGVVKQFGISFQPNEQALEELRRAGADAALISALRTSWHPDCLVLLTEQDLRALVGYLPGEKIVGMVERCGIGFQPTEQYYQGIRSTGANAELIAALRLAAEEPLSRDSLFQSLSTGADYGQIGEEAKARGINFSPTEEDFGKLRGAGASEALLQIIRAAQRVESPANPNPTAPAALRPGLTGTRAEPGPQRARAVCPPALSSIPVFSSPSDKSAVVARLGCNDLVTIKEKDSGRIGIDKILLNGQTEGFAQDAYLDSSIPRAITAPVPVYQPQPGYTPKAHDDHLEGTVVLGIVIDAQGNVTEVKETSKPLGDGLDEKAIETVRTWKFEPATRNGILISDHVVVEISFRLLQNR